MQLSLSDTEISTHCITSLCLPPASLPHFELQPGAQHMQLASGKRFLLFRSRLQSIQWIPPVCSVLRCLRTSKAYEECGWASHPPPSSCHRHSDCCDRGEDNEDCPRHPYSDREVPRCWYTQVTRAPIPSH